MRIVRGDRSFEVGHGDYDWVWSRFGAGAWEPETLAVFDRFVNSRTTVLDIGAWIGPTTLYAAQRARRVIAFEPDPAAFRELQANVALNPSLSNIELHQACIAVTAGPVRLGIDRVAGDSESSILYGEGNGGWTVPGLDLAGFIRAHQVERPLFIKMDIEGYEFTLVPALLDVLRTPGTVMHLSTHLRVFSKVAKKGARGPVARFIRKRAIGPLRGFVEHARLAHVLDQHTFVHDEAGAPIRLRRRLLRVLVGGGFTPTCALVISSEPLAALTDAARGRYRPIS